MKRVHMRGQNGKEKKILWSRCQCLYLFAWLLAFETKVVLCSPGWLESHNVDQGILKHTLTDFPRPSSELLN